jgi:hypothetical protein
MKIKFPKEEIRDIKNTGSILVYNISEYCGWAKKPKKNRI